MIWDRRIRGKKKGGGIPGRKEMINKNRGRPGGGLGNKVGPFGGHLTLQVEQ